MRVRGPDGRYQPVLLPQACQCCGVEFQPAEVGRKFCSRSCASRSRPFKQRDFSDYYEVPAGYITPCWVICIKPNETGYVHWTVDGRTELAHRSFYLHHRGELPPKGWHLDHLCRHPACVNPGHLEPVTHAENIRRGRNAKITMEIAQAMRASDESNATLALRYGVHPAHVSKIRSGKKWSVAA